MQKNVFTYDDYVKEREVLSKYEQANYDSYEKTILTLSGAFLAFSVSFLGLIKKTASPQVTPPTLMYPNVLVSCWVSFASSILLMLLSFLVNALAFRAEVAKIEDAVDSVAELERKNIWIGVGSALYVFAGTAFMAGLILLLVFCASNIHLF